MSTYPEVADAALEILRKASLLDDAATPVDWQAFNRVEKRVHERFTIPATTCTMAMAHVLFALAASIHPALIVGAGSYVGYMLAWLVAGGRSASSGAIRTVGLDVDGNANATAVRNFRRAGLLDAVEFVTEDACEACTRIQGIDLLLIDIDEPDVRKYRYAEVFTAALPNLSSGALVLAHDPLVPLFASDVGRFDAAVTATSGMAGPLVLPLDECGLSVAVRR